MLRTTLSLLVFLLGGCAKRSLAIKDVTGEFYTNGTDSGMLLRLQSDHSFSLTAVGYRSEFIPTFTGKWTINHDKLVLVSDPMADQPPPWKLVISKDRGKVVLVDGDTKFEKVPNKAPEPTP